MARDLRSHDHAAIIRKWTSTYYKEDDKIWLKGELVLSNVSLSFQVNPSEKTCFMIDLDSIADVKVERAWIGYKTLVVWSGSRTFWFSSFSSSQAVRRVLLHFMKEMLFQCPRDVSYPATTSGQTRTMLGSELLSIAHDSEKTLSVAASQLTTQGEQLDDALRTTNIIHRDLGIGSQNIAHLESWLGRWRVGVDDMVLNTTPTSSSAQSLNETHEFPIIYNSKNNVEESGILTVSPTNLSVCDPGNKTVIKFEYKEITTIVVSTPWSMVITRRMIGQPDVQCHVTSAKVITILKALESKIQEKIEYDEPDDVDFTFRIVSAETGNKTSNEGSRQVEENWPIREQQEQAQAQAVTETEIVTEGEVAGLNHVLGNIKSLALGIGNEMDIQDEKITTLTDDVTNLTEDVRVSNKRMQRLL